MTASLAHRVAIERDLPFIQHAWLTSFRGSSYAGPIDHGCYMPAYRATIDGIMARRAVSVIVAHNPGEDDPRHELHGFICSEVGAPRIVHYLYVKAGVRRMGIARSLLKAASIGDQVAYTFKTRDAAEILRVKQVRGARFHPQLVQFVNGNQEAA